MSKTFLLAAGVLAVYAFGYFTGIDYYKIFAVLAFIFALDMQIVATVEAARRHYITDMLTEIRAEKEKEKENDSEIEPEV